MGSHQGFASPVLPFAGTVGLFRRAGSAALDGDTPSRLDGTGQSSARAQPLGSDEALGAEREPAL